MLNTTNLGVIPSINEETAKGRFSYDVFSRVLKDRIIYVTGEFNSQMFELISAELLYLDSQSSEDITLIINSPGGEVYQLLGIVDVINSLKSKVNTICYGVAASCGAVLFLSATGKRLIGKNSRLMIHSVASGANGKLANLEESLKETQFLNNLIFELMEESVGKDAISKYKDKRYSDNWINAEEAVKEGLADEILECKTRKDR